MLVYLYLIKFEDGTETIAIGQEDHSNTAGVEEIFCSSVQYIDDSENLDSIISLIKEKMQEYPDPSDNTKPTNRIIN